MSVVSVVIPVYNRTVYLGATVESVLRQKFRDWELVIVDDGSTEDVCGFVSQFADSRVRYIRQDNRGNALARNSGICRGTGDFVICLDSDDVWHPEMLESCVATLQQRPDVDVVYVQHASIDGEGKPLSLPIGPEPREGNLLEALLTGFPILPSSALVRRSCFERWGLYTPGLDDWELWLRWAARGCRFACISRPLLYYRIHDRNFNLNWPKRREIHFAMLDAFYRLENLPDVAIQLRDAAYARQHLYFSVLAWQLGRVKDGVTEFKRFLELMPESAKDLDAYTRIACAHQGRVNAGTAYGFDLDKAQKTLFQCLDGAFADVTLPVASHRKAQAYGFAHYALARLAYSTPHDMRAARQFLWRGLKSWPPILWRTGWILWLGRTILGFERIQRFKRLGTTLRGRE